MENIDNTTSPFDEPARGSFNVAFWLLMLLITIVTSISVFFVMPASILLNTSCIIMSFNTAIRDKPYRHFFIIIFLNNLVMNLLLSHYFVYAYKVSSFVKKTVFVIRDGTLFGKQLHSC